jgi:hypothetical protein
MSHTPNRKAHSPAALPPESEVQPAGAGNGRDERGRFTKDNRFGPGNPFARRTAAFRRAIAAAVTEETIAAVIAKLTEAALAGDVAAIKRFLAYTVGKPLTAVNPDTLDLEELRQYERELLPGPTLGAIMTSPAPEVFLESARIMRPQLGDECMKKVLQGIDDLDAADREAAAAEAKESVERPATGGGEEEVEERPAEGGKPEEAAVDVDGPRRREARPAREKGGKAPPSGNGDNRARRGREKGREAPGCANRAGQRVDTPTAPGARRRAVGP